MSEPKILDLFASNGSNTHVYGPKGRALCGAHGLHMEIKNSFELREDGLLDDMYGPLRSVNPVLVISCAKCRRMAGLRDSYSNKV